MQTGESMRRDWDQRARKDAFFYIASWRKDWDLPAFLKSGEEDYERLAAPVFERAAFAPQGKTMLELGCGAGRMTQAFAQRFGRVLAFDVSAEMLDRARAIHGPAANISWIQGNGTDLSGIPSGSVDFVFSYLVLQHLPSEALVHAYVRETLRVLVDRGVCLLQFNGSSDKSMNWKGVAAWSVIDSLWSLGLGGAARSTAKILGLDPEMAGKSWHGAGVKSERVAEGIRARGGTIIEILGADTPMAWCCAGKAPRAGAAGA
jgi:SAM-dependent methyltransferase